MGTIECQIKDVPAISDGLAYKPPVPFLKRIRLMIARHLGPRFKRSLKRTISYYLDWMDVHIHKPKVANPTNTEYSPLNLQPGDLVRVRSKEEILLTLDRWYHLRGCGFMPEMFPYCGTTKRVLKPVHRFIDERDRQVKKAKGIVLLEDAICQGTDEFGPCDRSCFYFWREEWLEKVN